MAAPKKRAPARKVPDLHPGPYRPVGHRVEQTYTKFAAYDSTGREWAIGDTLEECRAFAARMSPRGQEYLTPIAEVEVYTVRTVKAIHPLKENDA